jgi:hypothetical protein
MNEAIRVDAKSQEKIKFLTTEETAKLLFLTFRFSQGDEKLQRYIINWIHGVFPQYKINRDTLGQINDMATTMATNYLYKSPIPRHATNINVIEAKDIRDQISNWSNIFASILDGKINDYLRTSEILDNITNILILRDHKYLIARAGRPNQTRKMESQVISHALNHRPTGSQELDLMFSKIGENLIRIKEAAITEQEKPAILSRLEEIEKVHKI